MQTAYWQLYFPIVLRELGTRHASPPRFNPVESVAPPHGCVWQVLHSHSTTTASKDVYNRCMLDRDRFLRTLLVSAVLLAGLTAVAMAAAPMTKINIVLKDQAGRPVDHASVLVRFVQGHSVVKLGKPVRTTFELRSNQEGEARIPSIPQRKILVQVIAKGYQTFGQTSDVAD